LHRFFSGHKPLSSLDNDPVADVVEMGKNQISTFMKPSHIEHLGIAVNSLEEAIPFYETILGVKCYNIEEVAEQKVKTAFFKIGQTKIELLEPTSPDSAVGNFLANRGQGVHHVAFAVEGLQGVLDQVAGEGIRLIDKAPRGGAEGLNIAFLHPKSTFGVLMELCENPNK
jgi:methylmalonyl-CoA/ethylmalonyl-CoA epimerase